MTRNSIANAIRILAIIAMVLGTIGSAIAGVVLELVSVAIVGIFSSFVFGIVLLGLSEIVNLLQRISDQQDVISDFLKPKYNAPPVSAHTIANKCTLSTKERAVPSDAKDIPYRCAECGTEGPYDILCPNCNSTAKIFKN